MELLDFQFAEVISAEWALRRMLRAFVQSEKAEEASWLGADQWRSQGGL